MIRRLLRLAVTGFCLLSLLASLALGWVWRRSYRETRFRLSYRMGDDRYAVRLSGGRFVLLGPPPSAAGDQVGGGGGAAVARLRNRDVRWAGVWWDWRSPRLVVGFAPDRSPEELWEAGGGAAGLARPLLAALDDPDRFAAAHVLLTEMLLLGTDPPPRGLTSASLAGGCVRVNYNGMRFDAALHPDESERLPYLSSNFDERPEAAPRIDPGQLPAIRDDWHDRLDVPVGAVPHWPITAATALPPLLWLAARGHRRLVRRRRVRLGLCPRCGYDLRGSPPGGRCSECGVAGDGKEAARGGDYSCAGCVGPARK